MLWPFLALLRQYSWQFPRIFRFYSGPGPKGVPHLPCCHHVQNWFPKRLISQPSSIMTFFYFWFLKSSVVMNSPSIFYLLIAWRFINDFAFTEAIAWLTFFSCIAKSYRVFCGFVRLRFTSLIFLYQIPRYRFQCLGPSCKYQVHSHEDCNSKSAICC